VEAIIDGVRVFYQPVGAESNYPLIVLHGGPGLDHTEMHPWLDGLSDVFHLIYVDERGQGRSQLVDPSTLSLQGFADDVSALAAALGLARYAVLGHSFGAFIALSHAIERGEASHYVISGGSASWTKTAAEVQDNLERFEPVALREQVIQSWAMEPNVKTQEDARQLVALQMPFHFATTESEAYRRFTAEDRTVYAPEVLAYFSAADYPLEYEDRLGSVTKPALIITGEHDRICTPRAARDLHAGLPGSELVILPGAGHQTYVEQPGMYMAAVRDFFVRHP
jgi:proline-specific peptidase